MKCGSVKAVLRQRFDEGRPLGADFDGHLGACAGCRAYRDRLVMLDRCVAETPYEAPGAAFSAVVRSRIAEDARGRRRRERAVMGAAVALVSLAAAALGWYYPLPIEPETLWVRVRTWLPQPEAWDWRAASGWAAEGVRVGWDEANAALNRLPDASPLVLWTAAGCFVLFLFVFNAAEAQRWRSVSSEGGRRAANGKKGGS